MILKDIAEKINMDISTVSRVANSKSIQTEFGVFPLKYFFSEGIATDSGEDVSSREGKNKLKEAREKAAAKVEERLLNSYTKIRNNARNGLGVVTITRNACGGCFNVVPPQRQAEVRERKKIIVCEHCGRIFVDIEDLPVVEEKKTRKARK